VLFPDNFPAAVNGDLPEFGLVSDVGGARNGGYDVADTSVRLYGFLCLFSKMT
jgi:hypothetical protein